MPIRRLVLLLIVVLFGSAAAEQRSRPILESPTGSEGRTAPAVFAAGSPPSDAVIRSSGRLLSAGWQTGSGIGPWPRPVCGELGRRTEPTDAPAMARSASATITTVVARAVEIARREYSRRMARAHSGFVSSPRTAPPPFRFV